AVGHRVPGKAATTHGSIAAGILGAGAAVGAVSGGPAAQMVEMAGKAADSLSVALPAADPSVAVYLPNTGLEWLAAALSAVLTYGLRWLLKRAGRMKAVTG
ncbi:MAG: hypothetical protein VW405_02645, partial [Rhodospirillaceae bacterium]